MDTATRSVAVVATRLPNIDRRVLSQAWYSALHLAHESPAAPAKPAPHAASSAVAIAMATPADAKSPARSAATAASSAAAHNRSTAAALDAGSAERRNPVSELSRRIEHVLARHAAAPAQLAPRPATIAIKAGDGRVQLLVRHDGATTRIIALCAPHLRDRVDRALAHARFALAAAGTRIEAA